MKSFFYEIWKSINLFRQNKKSVHSSFFGACWSRSTSISDIKIFLNEILGMLLFLQDWLSLSGDNEQKLSVIDNSVFFLVDFVDQRLFGILFVGNQDFLLVFNSVEKIERTHSSFRAFCAKLYFVKGRKKVTNFFGRHRPPICESQKCKSAFQLFCSFSKSRNFEMRFCTFVTRGWAVGGARELQSGRSAVTKVQKLFQLMKSSAQLIKFIQIYDSAFSSLSNF